MSNKEEELLLNKASKNKGKTPIFDAPEGKILAIGDMFRGPYTGITSDIDLENPGQKLVKQEEYSD